MARRSRGHGERPHTENNRFHRVFEELAVLGIDASLRFMRTTSPGRCASSSRPLMGYSCGSIRSIKGRLGRCSTQCLRDVASRGTWVSAHPDVILKMASRRSCTAPKHLGWGTDTHLYRTATDLRDAFPVTAPIGRPACPQADRGNGGEGVWKVDLVSGSAGSASVVRILHAPPG